MASSCRIWLDDIRTPPDDTWLWCRTVDAAWRLLESGPVDVMSLDHDLGMRRDGSYEMTGYDLVKRMAEHDTWPATMPKLHSANPVGVRNMQATIDRYGPYR